MGRLLLFLGTVAGAFLVTDRGVVPHERALALFGQAIEVFCPLAIAFMATVVATGSPPPVWSADTLAGFRPAEPDGTAARCPVCGLPGGGAWVSCLACETPCHADCACYVGTCSVYGCRGALLGLECQVLAVEAHDFQRVAPAGEPAHAVHDHDEQVVLKKLEIAKGK